MKASRRRTSLEDRLWRKVDKSGEHWIWTGNVGSHGYGQLARGSRSEGLITAHRAAWEVTYGPIPDGLFILHRCDIRACCKPDHLFLGTAKTNSLDMVHKGRCVTYRGVQHVQHKLTDDQVREIRRRVAAGEKQTRIAAEFGVSGQFVGQLAQRKRRAYVTDEPSESA